MDFSALLTKYSAPERRSLENSDSERVRYNVYSPEGERALVLFEKAVGLMQERSKRNPADPLGWTYQAGIHGIWNLDPDNPSPQLGPEGPTTREDLANFAEAMGFDTRENILDGNTVLNNCTHFTSIWNGSDLAPGTSAKVNIRDASPANFIAWHRLYLQYFEEIARENLRLSGEADAETWALPYWAYLNEDEVVMPEIFRDRGSSLYTPYRNSQLNAGIALTELTNLFPGSPPAAQTWPDLTLPGLYQNTYLAMGTLVESMPHNAFHLASGLDGGLFEDGSGLMFQLSAAAFDPIFWVHHAFIDKLWSAYNASENAFYAFQYDFDQNPWNYMFLTPSSDGSLQKETISYWGDNSANVISKIYNPDYSYDYFGTVSNPETNPGPNKALSIIQASAFRPVISTISWNDRPQPITEAQDLYLSVIPFTINEQLLTAGTYLSLTRPEDQNGSQFDFISRVEFMLPEPPGNATFLLTTASNIGTTLDAIQQGMSWGLFTQGMAMGHEGMAMPMTATIDFGYSVIRPDGTAQGYGYSYVPIDSNKDDPLVILMLTNAANASVRSVSTSLNQNLNINSSNDSRFDAAAYFAQFPELLTNPEATADPEAYYERVDRGRGIVAPEINFRAAATGMAYLMENNQLLHDGISASPYAAISHYLDQGQSQGRSLGDSSLITAKSYFRSNGDSDGIILDFTSLDSGQEISADVIIGRDAFFKPVVGFYHITDDLGTIVVDGISYKPGDPEYARLAISSENVFDELTGLNANSGLAEHRHAVRFNDTSIMLAPFAVVNEHTFFSFADANIDGINHFRIHGTNIIGLEDLLYGGDTDFDDTLTGFRFTALTGPASTPGSSPPPGMTTPDHMHG